MPKAQRATTISTSSTDVQPYSDKGSENQAGGKSEKSGGDEGRYSYFKKPVNLSPELASLVGKNKMAVHEVTKQIWAVIRERNLYDPKNKQYAICDDELFKVIGVKRFRTFGMLKFLKNHFRD